MALTLLTLAGCSLQQIACDIHVFKSTLLGCKQGAEPSHTTGEAFITYCYTVLALRLLNSLSKMLISECTLRLDVLYKFLMHYTNLRNSEFLK